MIAFLGFEVLLSEEGLVRGGLMVTDGRGDPLEFQVATSIRPNRVQRAIWGDGLERHAIVELLGRPLLRELQHRPQLALTNRIEALELLCDFPLAHLHHDAAPPVSDLPYGHRMFNDRRLCLTAAPHGSAGEMDRVLDLVDTLDELRDPLGAFDRICRALQALAETDDRYA